jgi:hypothetical protein
MATVEEALLVHHQEKGFEADMIAHQTDHLPEGVIVNTVIIATIMVPLGIDIVDVENVVHLPNALDAKKEKIRIEDMVSLGRKEALEPSLSKICRLTLQSFK